MIAPDAQDVSPSPEYSGDLDESEMAEQKTDRASSEASPSQQSANAQKPVSNAKDPTRPRRKKARRACYACQRAHLTCGDERPCHRCVKRNLQESCMDGVRKKAKYLHDAPNEALVPGIGGEYPHMNGGHPPPLPSQDPVAASIPQQGSFYAQAPSAPYYAQNPTQAPLPSSGQEGPVMNTFSNPQPPISPPYSQTNTASGASIASTLPPGSQTQLQHFGGPLFDPSDPALFNFDISSLNFGNHYGALEFGMLGHMSSGAAETPPHDNNVMNPLNQAANVFNPQMASGPYNDSGMTANMPFGPDGLPNADWQPAHSRNGSIQMQTPNNTPITTHLDSVGHRHDSLNGPHAYAIGQGPGSISSASPASTDVNSGYDNDNAMSSAAFFANQQQFQQRSPTISRLQHDQARNLASTALQPIQTNAMRKRRRDTSYIYNSITKPYGYTAAFHRLLRLVKRRFSREKATSITFALSRFRPILIASASELDQNDLVHSEQSLQRQLVTLEDIITETGTPVLVCRRTGEVVLMGKEFSILTGWKREVLLGKEPNLNVNIGASHDPSDDSGLSSRTSITPTMAGQEPDPGPFPVSIIELMDEDSAAQYLEDFSELAYDNSRGTKTRRVKLLKYRTKEDMAKLEELKANAIANGKSSKSEPTVKLEGSIHGEAGIGMLGARDGMVDCMICWHIKRDIFELPMLVVMNILPVLA